MTVTRNPNQYTEDVRGWHGWAKGDVSIHVGPMPGRRSICLYVRHGSVTQPVTYFRGPRGYEQAYRTLAVLDYLMGTQPDGTRDG